MQGRGKESGDGFSPFFLRLTTKEGRRGVDGGTEGRPLRLFFFRLGSPFYRCVRASFSGEENSESNGLHGKERQIQSSSAFL